MDEENLFFFESDHLALRGNKDYSTILKTLVILESQKKEIVQDIDKLNILQNKYLDDPESFVTNLTSGTGDDLPKTITIAEVPDINLKKYNVNIPKMPIDSGKQSDSNDVKVRGRAFDQTKPETFNQLWTCEEQRRLEELLVEYPPESIEMRRFAKIAKALGNRTTHQVASRVQKYFKKLYLAGMPIPGRLPKSRRIWLPKTNRLNKNMFRQSTFFPAHDVPVSMPDDDSFPLESLTRPKSLAHLPQEIPVEKHLSPEDVKAKIIKILETVKNERNDECSSPKYQHIGYKCDNCSEEPIFGTRWHCKTCDVQKSVDFCSDCLIAQLFDNNCHPLNHNIVPVYESLGYANFDCDAGGNEDDYESESDGDWDFMQ